jgi:hypothetical protein
VGIAATGFCYPGGILQVFIDKISKFFIDKINKFCGCRQQSDRFSSDHRDHPHQQSASTSSYYSSPDRRLPSLQIAGISNPVQVPRRKRQATEANLHRPENQSKLMEVLRRLHLID